MPRRRYRLFIVCAVVILFMLYRVAQNSWDEPPGYSNLRENVQSPYEPASPHVGGSRPSDEYDTGRAVVEQPKPKPVQQPIDDKDTSGTWDASGADEEDLGYKKPATSQDKSTEDDAGKPSHLADDDTSATLGGSSGGKFTHDALDTDSTTDTTIYPPDDGDSADPANLQWNNPPNHIGNTPEVPLKERIHWKKQEEHFPLPTNSIAPIPTGTPKKIPKIQYNFSPESVEAKTKRLERLERVKTEMQRAWAGYKKYAWLHDELSPVSGKFRDPFCGWAATLVDSLDTLWIAGMKTEFDEAAKTVGKIDFTWSSRNEIPVFETTIRYLGGLVAAYDVSGGPKGSYPMLLDKAVELAEILMGIFDTPNRMPLLYYQWRPEYASQPHRAGRVGIAELATLSMEFTRLAQITKEAKYYDAIDRITNGLVKLQEVGTTIPGLFPENLDTSGCNRTATTLRDEVSRAAQKQMETAELGEPAGYVGSQQQQRAPLQDSDSSTTTTTTTTTLEKRDAAPPADSPKRPDLLPPGLTLNDGTKPGDQASAAGSGSPVRFEPPFAANGRTSEWDCVPQGLTPGGWGYESYHMGGGQDSAYEYFPKEYLLLGGLEPKYQKLYEDTVEAVNQWLLFRPMGEGDDWDVLFPAKLSTQSNGNYNAQFEISHLTCFIGGMYSLGGKIFDRKDDLEKAKQLTDGCVWAYSQTPSGLMPEWARLLPCPSLEKCDFNETQWWDALDQSRDWRERELERWLEVEAKDAELRRGSGDGLDSSSSSRYPGSSDSSRFADPLRSSDSLSPSDSPGTSDSSRFANPLSSSDSLRSSDSISSPDSLRSSDSSSPSESLRTSGSSDLSELSRSTSSDPSDSFGSSSGDLDYDPDTSTRSSNQATHGDDDDYSTNKLSKRGVIPSQGESSSSRGSELPASLRHKLGITSDDDITEVSSSTQETSKSDHMVESLSGSDASADSVPSNNIPDIKPDERERFTAPERYTLRPQKPLSHEEYVQDKIARERLPPGWTTIGSASYILRPEAIESVWYMYRITGDTTWMDKGWRMFQATVQATRTEIANSAINNVMQEQPGLSDEMESFWLAETLKYYYLLFAEPDLISLDEWVLNTEAHPFKRPQ